MVSISERGEFISALMSERTLLQQEATFYNVRIAELISQITALSDKQRLVLSKMGAIDDSIEVACKKCMI